MLSIGRRKGRKGQENNDPPVRICMSPDHLTKMDMGRKSPSMWGYPDADIKRDIVQLLHERIEQSLLTIFIKIKAHRGDPSNDFADRWAGDGRQSENIRWSLRNNRPIYSWTENRTTHQSSMNPTVKKRTDLHVVETNQNPNRINGELSNQGGQLSPLHLETSVCQHVSCTNTNE